MSALPMELGISAYETAAEAMTLPVSLQAIQQAESLEGADRRPNLYSVSFRGSPKPAGYVLLTRPLHPYLPNAIAECDLR